MPSLSLRHFLAKRGQQTAVCAAFERKHSHISTDRRNLEVIYKGDGVKAQHLLIFCLLLGILDLGVLLGRQ